MYALFVLSLYFLTPLSTVAPSTGSVPTPPSSARSTGQIRRLPPTPTTPHNLPTSPSSFSMPEPDPYYDAARPGHYSSDSYASTSSSIDMLKRVTTGVGSRKLPQAPVQSFNQYSDRDSLSSIHSQNYDPPMRQPSSDPHAVDYRQVQSNGNNVGYGENYVYPTPPTPPAPLGFSRSLSHRPSYESISESSNNVPGLNYPDRRAGCAFFIRVSSPTRD